MKRSKKVFLLLGKRIPRYDAEPGEKIYIRGAENHQCTGKPSYENACIFVNDEPHLVKRCKTCGAFLASGQPETLVQVSLNKKNNDKKAVNNTRSEKQGKKHEEAPKTDDIKAKELPSRITAPKSTAKNVKAYKEVLDGYSSEGMKTFIMPNRMDNKTANSLEVIPISKGSPLFFYSFERHRCSGEKRDSLVALRLFNGNKKAVARRCMTCGKSFITKTIQNRISELNREWKGFYTIQI